MCIYHQYETDIIIKNNLVIGLKPFVIIFHWDTPLALEEKYGGFLSENIMYGDRN